MDKIILLKCALQKVGSQYTDWNYLARGRVQRWAVVRYRICKRRVLVVYLSGEYLIKKDSAACGYFVPFYLGSLYGSHIMNCFVSIRQQSRPVCSIVTTVSFRKPAN
jgi:hypothetical protein